MPESDKLGRNEGLVWLSTGGLYLCDLQRAHLIHVQGEAQVSLMQTHSSPKVEYLIKQQAYQIFLIRPSKQCYPIW